MKSQYTPDILRMLSHGPMRVSDVAVMLGLSSQQVHAIKRLLIDDGIVVRPYGGHIALAAA